MVSDLDIGFNAWVAGFWEGEGCLYARKRVGDTYGYTVKINQAIYKNRTVESAMYKLRNTFGGYVNEKNPPKANNRVQMCWRLHKRADIERFIKAIYPHCQLRKPELDKCLAYYKSHPPKTKINIDINEIKRMREQGLSYRTIGKEFGVSSTVIWYRYNDARNREL